MLCAVMALVPPLSILLMSICDAANSKLREMNFANALRAPFVFTIHLTIFFLLCYAEEQGMVEVDMLISCWLTENQF